MDEGARQAQPGSAVWFFTKWPEVPLLLGLLGTLYAILAPPSARSLVALIFAPILMAISAWLWIRKLRHKDQA